MSFNEMTYVLQTSQIQEKSINSIHLFYGRTWELFLKDIIGLVYNSIEFSNYFHLEKYRALTNPPHYNFSNIYLPK